MKSEVKIHTDRFGTSTRNYAKIDVDEKYRISIYERILFYYFYLQNKTIIGKSIKNKINSNTLV